ncbi:LysR family transcriptional regulator [Massilia sp. Root418]|uniref:LysR family transcriptional regulator n=1 Tax=Massilia sp. Root418 TaxID=1736532 RepID=UPI0006FA9ECC|nr:LysR family transcriptional regulator [Massilia sp. Root418]KQW99921.1 LysR family transcriptional regulator [Massilia sp. Root418]
MDRLDALKVFCTVVESGGFSRAADKLGISTSSVTNQVAALEAHFGVKLLNRTTRSMSLTGEGRQCHAYAQRLLAEMGELEDSLQESAQQPRGVLRVDMPGILARRYVAPALPLFMERYPDITLRVTAGDRFIDMVEEGVDVLLRIGELPDSQLVARTLCRTQYVTCAAPSFIARHGVPQAPEQLGEFPCLNFLYPKSRQVRAWRFQQGGEAFSHTPQGKVAMDHVEALIAAAAQGAGIVQHLSVSLREPLRSGALVPLLQEWQADGPDVSVLYQRKHQRAAKVKAFVDFVGEVFAEPGGLRALR